MGSMIEFVRLYTKKGSISNARASVINFLSFIYGEQPGIKEGVTKKEEIESYNRLSVKYVSDKSRDHLTDAIKYAASLSASPPLTAKSRLNGVRGFFGYNKIEFSDRQWKQASGKLPKGKGARTREIEIDVVTIKAVLEHADIRMKALVTFLCSTGCRINEALSLDIDDVKFDGDKIAKVSIPGHVTKTGEVRECYCSTEAVRYLKEWLKIRESYMEIAGTRGNGIKVSRPSIEGDTRLFPFTDHTAGQSWNGLTLKAGFGDTDRNTKRRTLHIHMFRKFFRSQLAMKCPVDVVENLMGHEGYLIGAYGRLTKAQIKESYEKGSSVLHIFGDANVAEIREELDSTVKSLNETRNGQEKASSALSGVVLENQSLKEQLAKMHNDIETINQKLAAMNTLDSVKLTDEDRRIIVKNLAEELKKQK